MSLRTLWDWVMVTLLLWGIWEWTIAWWGDGNSHERLASIAIVLGALYTFFRAAAFLRRHFGKFELKFLDPLGPIDPPREKRATVLRLLPGESVVRVSLRPRVAIKNVRGFAFTALTNRNCPMRWWPGAVGRNKLPSKAIVPTKIRRRLPDETWEEWHDVGKRETEGNVDVSWEIPRGSRQVFEIVYKVDQPLTGWDGIFGCVVRYDSGSGFERSPVNPKMFIGESGYKPLTFKLRRVNSSTPFKRSTPDTPTSPPGATS